METVINNRYQIEEKLGQGGMGSVYRAHDSALDREVAIKILSNTDLGTEGRARLLQEARMIAKLNHPNIVTVHDVGEIEGTPFIVMELVEGIDLHQHKTTSISEIIAITRQLCSALEHAHNNEIIHRDLKPENIVITPDGATKLMDFGLARSVASRLTTEGTIVGTVFYLAPEQALGQGIDYRSDLYALGVLLYELLTGQLPFQADDPIAVISQHIHAPVVPPRARNERIPIFLNDLILRLMAKMPEDRPASAQEVRLLLETPESLETEISPPGELSVLDRIVRGRMVGREMELQQSRQLWGQATRGEGQLLLVSGEPGVGKTRLMREIVTQAEVGGGQAFIGESQADGNAPYAAFAQIARRVLRAQGQQLEIPDLVMAELIAIVPGLQVDYPKISPNPKLEPESESNRLLDCFYRFITILSQKKPLLLVLEDLHWADSGTLGLLRFLAQRMQEMPIMLLGTYRQVELDQALPFHETLLYFNRRNLGRRIKLERLDQDQTREMLAVLFAEEIKPEFLAGIYKETEGNPFFIEEVCKALVESGQVYFDGERWQRPPDMVDMIIPQSIKVAVQSRLSKLSTAAQEILLNAAVIGREFDFQTLWQVTGKEEETLIDGLEAALKTQLIEEHVDEVDEIFVFSHALIPVALREGLSGLRRKRIHRQIAQVTEELQPEAFQRLAYHWGEAGDEDKGLDFTIKAADQARKRYANEDAIRLYTEALALLSEDHEDRFDLLAARAEVYDITAQREAQLADIQAMLALAEALDNDIQQVDALLALTNFYLEIDVFNAKEPAEQALEMSRKIGDTGRQARASYLLGVQRGELMELIQEKQYVENAVELARAGDSNQDLVEYLSYFARLLDDHDAALDSGLEAVALSQEIDNKRLEIVAKLTLAGIYLSGNRPDDALTIAEQVLEQSVAIGDLKQQFRAINLLGLVKRELGLWDQAEAHFLEILQGPFAFRFRQNLYALIRITNMYRKMGDYEKSINLLTALLDRADQEDVDRYFWGEIADRQSEACLDLGKYQEGLEYLAETIQYYEKANEPGQAAVGYLICSRLAFLSNDFILSQSYQDKGYKLCLGLEESLNYALVLLVSAELAFRDGRPEVARIGLEQFSLGFSLALKNHWNPGWSEYYISAGLHLALAEEDPSHTAYALVNIEKAINENKKHLLGWYPPESLFILAFRVYRKNNLPEQADEFLHKAYERVSLVAGKIQDDDLRRSYLENVTDNREILKEAKARGWCS